MGTILSIHDRTKLHPPTLVYEGNRWICKYGRTYVRPPIHSTTQRPLPTHIQSLINRRTYRHTHTHIYVGRILGQSLPRWKMPGSNVADSLDGTGLFGTVQLELYLGKWSFLLAQVRPFIHRRMESYSLKGELTLSRIFCFMKGIAKSKNNSEYWVAVVKVTLLPSVRKVWLL